MDTRNVARLPAKPKSAQELMKMGAQANPIAEVERLTSILEPSTDEDSMAVLSFMFKVLPIANVEDEESLAIIREAYLMSVRGYPRWAILEARDAFIRGQVEGYKSSFAPNPADLGREISRRVDDYRGKLARAKRLADEAAALGRNEDRRPFSDETKAYAKAALERMRASAEAERESLSRKVGPDLSQYYKHKPDSYEGRPLTAEDLKDIPGREPSKAGLQHVSGYNPLPGNGGRQP